MKLKNILLIAAAIVLSAPAFAQDNEKQARDTRWFIGAGGGMNFGIDGKFEDYKNSNYGAGTSVEAYVGKFFNDWLGFRAGYQGFSISEDRGTYGKDPFHYGHADLLFRVTDWFVPYVHGGYAQLHKGSPAGGIGIMMPIKISDRISLVPDLKATALNGNAFSEGEKKFAANLGGSLGLRVMLGKKKEKATDDNGAALAAAEAARKAAEQAAAEEAARKAAEEAARKKAYDDSVANAAAEAARKAAEAEEAARKAHEAALAELAKALDIQTLFDFDSSDLTDDAKSNLDKVAEYLKVNDAIKVEVGGHTDNMGSDEYNKALSQRRAESVINYLTGKGIDKARLTAVGYGKDKPIATNDTEEGRHQNRRIEFKVK